MNSLTNSKKQIWGWALFDVANSSYTTIIITVAFNVIFVQMIVGADATNNTSFQNGNFYWSLLLSISNLISAFAAPVLGAITDVFLSKKKALAMTVLGCSLTCAALFFAVQGDILLAASLVVVSNLMFNLSENIISSFLPHIVPPQKIGRVSGLAWGLGYFGGLAAIVICFLASGFKYTQDNWPALRWIGPLTGLFFMVFSLPTFLWVKEPLSKLSVKHASVRAAIKASFAELLHTVRHLRQYRDLARFLLAFFFFQGGLTIVIGFAALYGAQVVGITGIWQMIFFITLQLTAAAGAWGFGLLQERLGILRTINMTLVIWIITIALIYFLEDIGRLLQLGDIKPTFIVFGNLAGLCLGATQSLARSMVALLSPKEYSGEFFGFWGFAGKMAAVFALFVFGMMQQFLSIKASILACCLFFIIGMVINLGVKEPQTVAGE